MSLEENMGLHELASRFADLAEEIAASRKGAHERRRRIIAGAKSLLREAVLVHGFDLPLVAVRGNDAATLAIVDLRKKLRGLVDTP